MRPNYSQKLLPRKINHKQNENTTHRIEENIFKQYNWQRIDVQNLQTAHTVQYKI